MIAYYLAVDIEPKVGIIIPTYNGASFILRTLQSVQNQTFKDWEAIIVVDGSIDDTEELLRGSHFSDDYRFRFYVQENKGVSAARNFGIAQSSAEFIALLDHDDIWHPTKLSKQIRFLEGNPKYTSCICWYLGGQYRNDNYAFSRLFSSSDIDLLMKDWLTLRGNGPLLPSTLMFRRLAVQTRFDENLNAIGDLDFLFRLTSESRVGILREPLVLYIQHVAQMHRDSSAIRDYRAFYSGLSHQSLERFELKKSRLVSKVGTHIEMIELFEKLSNLRELKSYFDIIRIGRFWKKSLWWHVAQVAMKRLRGYFQLVIYQKLVRGLWK